MRRRVAPLPLSSRPDRVAFQGCPFHAPFVPSRRLKLRVAPWSQSFGPPAMDARVAPSFACVWRCQFQQGSELPRWRLLPPASPLIKDLGCPLSSISGFTGDGHRVAPMLIFRRCRDANSRVAPRISLSVSPTIRRPSCPALRILRHRLMDIRVTPDHAPTGSPLGRISELPRILFPGYGN
jgi:hypothetical protein